MENIDPNKCTGNCNQGRNCDCATDDSGMLIAFSAVALSGFIVGVILGIYL